MVFWNIIALLFLGILLAISAGWVVKATSYFSKILGIKSFVIGFLLLGLATTIPEMFVAYQAISDGIPQLSVGNLLGGSILLLSFFMGASAIILKRIVLDHGMTKKDIIFASCVVAAPAVALWDGALSRIEGVILIAIYLIHVLFLEQEQHLVSRVEGHAKFVRHPGHAIVLLIGGLLGMAVSSRFLVTIAEGLAIQWGLSEFIVGLFLVTFGTNLPELTLIVEAIISKKKDVAFGDVLGSAVINTPLLGVVCLISPFAVDDPVRMRSTLILLGVVSAFFLWAASSKRDITRREGIILFMTYVAFVLFEVYRQL